MTVSLKSPRLIVRDWCPDEVEGRYRIFGNDAVRQFISFGSDSKQDAAAELADIIKSQLLPHPRPSYFFAVELLKTGDTIGNVGFEYRVGAACDKSDLAEIGYFFEPAAWGQGYATEACLLIIDFAFSLGATQVIAECDLENLRSERLMQRCGMQPLPAPNEGRRRYGILPARSVAT